MISLILKELRHHMPFTILGAISGIVIMLLFRGLSSDVSYKIFYILHPTHVLLSALVTASLFSLHKCAGKKIKCNIFALLAIGFVGSIGIATLSDSIIPYIGETMLNMPHREAHIGFLEEAWIVIPLALVGIAIAYFRPMTKFPHAGHVFVSTWASLFHMMMAKGECVSCFSYVAVFFFLFIAVWIPCCISDIVFPLLFVKKGEHV